MEKHNRKALNTKEIKQVVRQIVSGISRIDAKEFEDEVIIRDELGIDSLMAMEIMLIW